MSRPESAGEAFASCTTTADANGVHYNERLRRLRESGGRSSEDVASELGVSLREYEEWENHPGELTRVLSLQELYKLAAVLGVPAWLLFDDKGPLEQPMSTKELHQRLSTYLSAKGLDVQTFEDRIGFAVEPALKDSSEILNWNLDCLRFVCKELGLDWHAALP